MANKDDSFKDILKNVNELGKTLEGKQEIFNNFSNFLDAVNNIGKEIVSSKSIPTISKSISNLSTNVSKFHNNFLKVKRNISGFLKIFDTFNINTSKTLSNNFIGFLDNIYNSGKKLNEDKIIGKISRSISNITKQTNNLNRATINVSKNLTHIIQKIKTLKDTYSKLSGTQSKSKESIIYTLTNIPKQINEQFKQLTNTLQYAFMRMYPDKQAKIDDVFNVASKKQTSRITPSRKHTFHDDEYHGYRGYGYGGRYSLSRTYNILIGSIYKSYGHATKVYERYKKNHASFLKLNMATIVSGFRLFNKSVKFTERFYKNIKFIYSATLVFLLRQSQRYARIIDDAHKQARQHLSIYKHESIDIENIINRVGRSYAKLGVEHVGVARAINVIADEYTSIVAYSDDVVENVAILNKSFSIAESISIKFSKTLAGISASTMQAQQSMFGYAREMAKAYGVPLKTLMEDVANASDNVRIFIGNVAEKLIESAAATRRLGIDLESVAGTAKALLNFETNIADELRASALIGQNINFNNARRLAFHRDLVGMSKEILRIAKETRFQDMNVIQQENFAKAAGLSVSKIQTMIQQEESLNWIRAYGSKEQQKQLQNYERMRQLSASQRQDEADLAMETLRTLSTRARFEELGDQWKAFMLAVVGPTTEKFVIPLLSLATKYLPKIYNMFGYIGQSIITITKITPFLSKWLMTTLKFSRVLSNVAKVFGFLTGGWIINFTLMLITLFIRAGKIWESFQDNIGKGILVFIDTLLEGFFGIFWTGFKHLLGINKFIDGFISKPIKEETKYIRGESPSPLGKDIVKGLEATREPLKQTLRKPIDDHISYVKSIQSELNKLQLLSIKHKTPYVSDRDISTSTSTDVNVEKLITINETQLTKLDEVVNSINNLVNALSNGEIGINIDGTKVNYALSQSRELRGNYGAVSIL